MKPLLAMTAVATMSCAALGDPEMPTQFFTENTVMVAQVDLTALTPQAIRDTVYAVLDFDEIGKLSIGRDMKQQIDAAMAQVGQVSMITGMLSSQGADTISIVMMAPEEADGEPSVFVLLPASSEQSAQQMGQMFGGMLAPQGFMTGYTGQYNDDTEAVDHWVYFAQGSVDIPEDAWSPRVQGEFDEAMSSMGDWPMKLAVVPNLLMRDMVLDQVPQEPAFLAPLARTAMEAEWMGLWVELGTNPEIGLGAQMADEADADIMQGSYAAAMEMLMEEARKADADAREDEDYEGPLPSEMASFVRDALQMERSGSRIRVKLDKAELRGMTTMMFQIADGMGEGLGEMMGEIGNPFGGN
ncbi:MAG: hypothetical protein ACF8SC_07120 [Phycisphaerales bacterium JB037]